MRERLVQVAEPGLGRERQVVGGTLRRRPSSARMLLPVPWNSPVAPEPIPRHTRPMSDGQHRGKVDDDPHLARIRAICLSLPGADEKVSHGSPTFFTRKVFAVFGGSLKGDHYSPVARQALLFLPDASEREALGQDERFFVPAYFGPSGWLGLSFHLVGGVDRVDWEEVAELVEMSYRLTAPAALVRELDAGTAS